MLKLILHTILLLALFALTAAGQQAFFFSQYIQDGTAINPAYAGSQEALTLTAQYRHQWMQVEGAPVYQGFSAHAPIISQNIGLGLRFSNDKVAGLGRQMIIPSFAYRIRLSKGKFIAAGLQASLIRQQPEFENIQLRDPDDPAFASGPAGISASAGTGLFYASENFYAGFSVPDLFPDLGGNFQQAVFQAAQRSYIFHSGVVLPINPEVKLKPNVLVVMPEKGNLYMDVNLLALFREVLWLGGSYRTGRGIGAMAQVQLNPQLAVAYGYDLALKNESFAKGSSHELSLQYRFYFIKTGVKSPRYF